MQFDDVFDRLIGVEGDYVNDPKDPGGETKYGISKRAYPELDIAALTREDAEAIYLRDFWNPIEADMLPEAVTFQLFDFAVNSGIETATRYLQRALGVADDGHFGPESKRVAALYTAAPEGEERLVMQLNAERLDFMTKLKNWPVAGKGWARRIAENLRYGVQDTQ